jgi:DNA-binding transcriptional LysR family regulator
LLVLDLRRLRLLLEFASRGSIAATAEALGYTPSAVSQQLATLEREAGAALLDRTARSAELTDSGRRLAVHAEDILARVEAAEADLSVHVQTPSGRVVVSAFPTAAVAFAPALARSLQAYPTLTLLMRQTGRDEGLRQVRSGEVDVALVDDWSGRLPERETGMLRPYHLFSDPLVLVVPRDHWMADPGEPVDLRRLREEPWMATPVGEPSRQAVDWLLAGVGGAPPVPWEFEGLATILGLVARGIGIAAIPALTLAAGDIRPRTRAGQAAAGGGAINRAVAVRQLPGTLARNVYAVARSASVRRPSVAHVLTALDAAAVALKPAT